MKAIVLTTFLCFILTGTIFSNPIILPPKLVISEIYFSPGGWVIEAVANDSYDIDNLDSVTIETSAGKAYFKSGITFVNNQVIKITSDSLKTPLSINSAGDFIHLEEKNENIYWYGETLRFGNHPQAMCSSPFSGQSLSVIKGLIYHYLGEDSYIEEVYKLSKMNTPTLGNNPFSNAETDTLKGYIVDMNDKPISNAQINYLYYTHCQAYGLPYPVLTNSNGYFEVKLYSSYYDSAQIMVSNYVYKKVNLKVELDSANFYRIKLDNYSINSSAKLVSLIKDYNIRVFPNPVNKMATFEISFPSSCLLKKAIIKIYNRNGQILEILPVIHGNNQSLVTVNWNIKDNLPDGEYFYSLEMDNKQIKSDKILISR